MVDKQKEEEFFSKDFNFSYSALNRLLFSPSLFYKDYILKEKEIRLDKHLIEGSVIHCLLFEADKLNEKFKIVPGKTPSDSVKKVLYNMTNYTDAVTLEKVEDFVILDSLKEINLYQSLKKDEQRLAKIRTTDNADYWAFIMNDIKEDLLKIKIVHDSFVSEKECSSQKNIDDIKRMFDYTGCDGVMIARAAQGNPWIFDEAKTLFKKNYSPHKITLKSISKMCEEHLNLLIKERGNATGMNLMLKHFSNYLKGFPKASIYRQKLVTAETLENMRAELIKFKIYADEFVSNN